jgi:hypothetical protein
VVTKSVTIFIKKEFLLHAIQDRKRDEKLKRVLQAVIIRLSPAIVRYYKKEEG